MLEHAINLIPKTMHPKITQFNSIVKPILVKIFFGNENSITNFGNKNQ